MRASTLTFPELPEHTGCMFDSSNETSYSSMEFPGYYKFLCLIFPLVEPFQAGVHNFSSASRRQRLSFRRSCLVCMPFRKPKLNGERVWCIL